jgi:uncharacterized protein (DUF4415 family)
MDLRVTFDPAKNAKNIAERNLPFEWVTELAWEAAVLQENPEWTREEIRTARPALEAIVDIFGTQAAETIRRRGGRPAKADRKVNQTLRLDPDVLDAYKQEGSGWQAHMNEVLRQHMPRHEK